MERKLAAAEAEARRALEAANRAAEAQLEATWNDRTAVEAERRDAAARLVATEERLREEMTKMRAG